MRILHITHHKGCEADLHYVCDRLNYELDTQFATWNYNVTEKLATEIWEKHKDYYNKFDIIITSDTAPLCRILLQNNFKGKLIVWVCNRFDYNDGASNEFDKDNNPLFPDKAYYEMFRATQSLKHVKVISYTKFEHEYASKYRDVKWKPIIIKPCSYLESSGKSDIPVYIDKSKTFFITRYHNDNILLDLKAKCESMGIEVYRGSYNGASDLKGMKGIIHIPYAWSNFAIFESFAIGNVHFIPTKEFLFNLADSGDFFWSPPFDRDLIESSEWYLPEHKELFVYFNNWDQLKKLTSDQELINEKRKLVKEFSKSHIKSTIAEWKNTIENW